MSDSRNQNDDSPERIESRIRETQENLRSDIDALEDKVSPEALKRQAQERVDETTEQLRQKAVEATHQVGDAVRERLDGAVDRVRHDDRMSTIGFVGLVAVIAVGMLLTRRSRDRTEVRRYERPYEPGMDPSGEFRSADARASYPGGQRY